MWVVWCASRISACSPTSRTQSAESCAASRKPRVRSMRVIAEVCRLVMVNFGVREKSRKLDFDHEVANSFYPFSTKIHSLNYN
jgi:hypothetical protein